jgi:hypothetical protein
MSGSVKARLEQLETQHGKKYPPIVWIDHDETNEQGRARWIAEHPDKDPATKLMFVSWLTPA